MKKILLIFALTLTNMLSVAAADTGFSDKKPLVYEDADDLWPYCFIGENGEPQGYNIDLLKLLFRELDIPYVVRLKPTLEALKDLREGHSNLMFGMDAHFHDDYATYGRTTLQLFTHSVVHVKGKAPQVKAFGDLRNHKVIVHAGSFSHHLMQDQGWGDNAIPYDDMVEAVKRVSQEGKGEIVWNTMSLKYLLRTYKLDNLELTRCDIPHGEYKFMGNDTKLLARLDSAYSVLHFREQLRDLQNKWFYPEKKETMNVPTWVWWLLLAMLGLGFIIFCYYLWYRHLERKMTHELRRDNAQLALILQTSGVRLWTFNVATKTFTWIDSEGNSLRSYSAKEFAKRFSKEDYQRLLDGLQKLVRKVVDSDTFDLKAAAEEMGGEVREFTVTLSVLRRSPSGRPSTIIGTRTDVTDERRRHKQAKDNRLRYQAIFDSAMVDMVYYDADGYIADMNERAQNTFKMNLQDTIQERVHIKDAVDDPDFNIEDYDTYRITTFLNDFRDNRHIKSRKVVNPMGYELQLVPVYDTDRKLLGVFGSGRDVTEVANSYHALQKHVVELEKANQEVERYINNIDYVLHQGGVRMVIYSPTNHTLTVFREIGHEEYSLTQMRVMNFIDEESRSFANRLFTQLDNLTEHALDGDIKTTIRTKNGGRLWVELHFIPIYGINQQGERVITSYFGMIRDVSQLMATEKELERETAKAQEVETVKNTFLRNMSFEIRTPLSAVVGFADMFQEEHTSDDETLFINQIKDNAAQLLELINDILYLSRLDARMIEFKREPQDFCAFFEGFCAMGWSKDQHEGVDYQTESPYSRLITDVDTLNLGIVIERIVGNAASHTEKGFVHARYDVIGDELVITVADSGCGIPKERMDVIFERFASGTRGTGLTMSICHEVVSQMGGTIELKSEVGQGTTVWISIPCNITETVRKK